MTIDPSAPGFMRPLTKPQPPSEEQCKDGKHNMPSEWDYTHSPAGSMTCRVCGLTWYD